MTNSLQLVHLSRLDVDFSIGVAFLRGVSILIKRKFTLNLRNFDVTGVSMLGNLCQTLTPLKKGSFSGLPLGFEETSKKKEESDQTFGKEGKTTGFLVGDVFLETHQ